MPYLQAPKRKWGSMWGVSKLVFTRRIPDFGGIYAVSEKNYKKTVTIEIDFDKPVCPSRVPSIISNRDSVLMLGANIEKIRILEENAD